MERDKVVAECNAAIKDWERITSPDSCYGNPYKYIDEVIDAGDEVVSCLQYLMKGERHEKPRKDAPPSSGAPHPQSLDDDWKDSLP